MADEKTPLPVDFLRFSATLHTLGRKDNPESLLRDANGEYVKFEDYERLRERVHEMRFELQNWLFSWGTTGPLSERTKALLGLVPAKEGDAHSAAKVIAALEKQNAHLTEELTLTVEALERANAACEQAGRTLDEYRVKFGALPPQREGGRADPHARQAKAQETFARFDFGLELEGFDGFESNSPNELRRAIYLPAEEGREGSQKAWFVLRFKPDSLEIEEAYAITRSGSTFGRLPP